MLKIIVLSDNRTFNSQLETEHGLSVYLETDTHKILLDTGASDLLLRNAHRLGVDLTDIDIVFISHGHSDHIGGLSFFLEINSKAKVFLSEKIINTEFYSKRGPLKNISVQFDLQKFSHRFVFVNQNTYMDGDIYFLKNDTDIFPMPYANKNLLSKNASSALINDDFSHELIFACGKDKLFVYTGCAHKGVLNILETVKHQLKMPISCVFGGLHLLDSKELEHYEVHTELEHIARLLNHNYQDTLFVTGHCTGCNVFQILMLQLQSNLSQFHVGYSRILP